MWLVTWKWWDRFILAVILANAAVMALTDYSPSAINVDTGEPDWTKSQWNALVHSTEPIFTSIFTVECICKVSPTAAGILCSLYLPAPVCRATRDPDPMP